MPQQKTLLERVGSFGARDSVIDMTPEEAEANLFEGRDASFSEVIKAYPQTMGPFLALAHNIMDRDGAFTQGEKYLMAGFVGKLLNCSMCRESLESAAISFGVDDGVLSALADNIDTSPVSPALKPVLKYVRKLVLDPSSVERDDTQSILDAGWSKQAIFDANSISGVIGMSARMVMGTHVTNTAENNKNTGQLLATVCQLFSPPPTFCCFFFFYLQASALMEKEILRYRSSHPGLTPPPPPPTVIEQSTGKNPFFPFTYQSCYFYYERLCTPPFALGSVRRSVGACINCSVILAASVENVLIFSSI